MVAKKIVIGLSFVVLILGAFLYFSADKIGAKITEKPTQQKTPSIQTEPIKPKEIKKKYDLYTATPYDLPLYSIIEISSFPDEIKKCVDNLLDNAQGFYFLTHDKEANKIIILLQNPINSENTYTRHNLQFAEIFFDGKNQYHTAGYNGIHGETINAIQENSKKSDSWKFDKSYEPFRPLKHTSYDEKGKVKYTEFWNYDDDEPIKYQMKDSKGKSISILKETFEGETGYRKEHIFYDNDGNITLNITINYDGANISRFTYYNANSNESLSIISEYTNGLKTKESIYNADYSLKNTVEAEYNDGIRKSIKIKDVEGNEIKKISS